MVRAGRVYCEEGERHRLVRRMHVVEERTLSDHKPKRMIDCEEEG